MDLRFHRHIDPPAGFDSLVSFDVAPSGNAITTWATAEGLARLTTRTGSFDTATFPVTRPERPVDVAVVEHAHRADQATILKGITTSFISTQRLPNGYLVVGARCQWAADGAEHNALVFNFDGDLTNSAVFGDGIQHILTTPTGNSWVGYFDEGIFGNFGWGGPGPEPVGRFGINRFDQHLGLAAHAPDAYDIADCYALTTDGETAWACCYTDWDIIRLDADGRRTAWSNTIAGASALLTRFPHVRAHRWVPAGQKPGRHRRTRWTRLQTSVHLGPDRRWPRDSGGRHSSITRP